ncbi:putative ribonuclease H-like domain-containing protein [Tanacetum coccineum]|uniref:Ribonuclease H-like domain-containing protein n=1 Tax=Tanacetum coccineum TaxID=301880 RepID=A0ABQ5I7N8_9ASTR
MVPRALLMKSGLVLVNTARQVNTAHSKTTVNAARPMSYLSKIAHSTVKRPIHKNTSFKNSNINQRVNTARDKKFNTARPKAVVNAVKGNNFNVVKASACWVWKSKTKVLDHVSKHNSASITLRKFDYVDAQGKSKHMTGNMSYLTNYEEIDGGYVAFGGNPKGEKITGKVPRKNNMYSVDLKNIVPKGGLTCLFAKDASDESKLWHKRLGHLNFKTINKLVKGNLVRGLPSKLFENYQTCVACQKGKHHRAACKSKTENSISLPLYLLHMDLFGPTFVKSLMKKMYCLVITDDYSRFTWVFFLATKDETSGILKSFITGIENLVDHKVKVIRCDNGIEFKNREINQFYEMKGILREFSVARTPQQNKVAERRNRIIIKAVRTMIADSKLPTTFWTKAVNTACYVPFGCPVSILNTLDHLGKFDGKADEGFFVGYSLNSKAFRVFNSRTRIMEENLHIRFSKNTPNVHSLLVLQDDRSKPLIDDENKVDEDPRKDSKCNDQEKEDNVNNTNNVNAASTNEVNAVGGKTSIELPFDPNMPALEDVSIFNASRDDEDDGAEADMNNLDTTIQGSPILTTRIHKDHPLDQVIGDLQSSTQTRRMSKNLEEHGFVRRTQKGNSCIEGSKLDRGYAGRASTIQATRNERGIMIRNKARLVAQGYTQEEGIDYDEVFVFVARIEAIRLFLAYASFKDFVVYQMDVKSAFLYGKIEEEVYVCQPLGFEDPNFPDRVYKVEKHCMDYIKLLELSDILLVQVYVNDIIFGSTKKELCLAFEKLMHEIFKMSSMGELTFFLGLQVKQKKYGIFISQDKYVDEIFKKFGFTEVKTASIPMETQKPLLKDEDGEEVDVHMYRSMIGSLMYLTSSRLDIMFAVCACAKYQVNPKISHLHAVKRVFRYLKGQPKLGLWYPKILLLICSKTIAWTEFSSTMASTIICLATNQKFNFSKYIFESMVKNLDNVGKFLMYPRFIQVFLDKQLEGMPTHNRIYITPSYTKKIFRNIRRVGKGFSRRETPLFQTIVVQDQAEMGEGLTNPIDPHHTPTFIQPSTSQPQKKQKSRKPKRKDTQIPQSSGTTKYIADEAIYKELDDSLVRNATTASSLEAEQDSGNINKTQSKATPNESSSLGTTSGGGPRGNTLRSGDDSLKVKKLMELCTKLQTRVLDLEKTKTTQAEEIVSLKRRVKKLKHKKRSRTHGLKRLYKVGLTARVESFGDEESLGEDASKQGRINAIDADEDITLVNDQDDTDMFDVNTLTGDEVLAEQEVATKDVNLIVNEVTLAQAVAALKSVKPKVKANVVEEPSIPASAASTKVSAATTTTTSIIPTPRKGNVITELEAKRLQAVFDEEERLAREKDEANVGSKTAS